MFYVLYVLTTFFPLTRVRADVSLSACQLVRGHCSVIVIIVSVVTSLSMEAETDWLASLNRQLTRTIVDLQTRLKIEAEDKERRSLKQLFSLGCGFTGAVLIMISVQSL